MEMPLPTPYVARPYRGREDHVLMAPILNDYRRHAGKVETRTPEQFDVTYANLTNCDPASDIAIVETTAGEAVAYARVTWEDLGDGSRDLIVFSPTSPEHLNAPLFLAMVAAQERHARGMADGAVEVRFQADAPHPGPGRAPTGEAAWLESIGYHAILFTATLVRPHLDDVPDRVLPAGVDVRPVLPEHVRAIWEAHQEAFRGAWNFHEPQEEEYQQFILDPLRDESLWKIAWAGDTVVGQVRSFINAEENEAMGYRRGYTENISTHVDWRNQGIAGALLAMSLQELKQRGMTDAALGAETDNPGGAFHLYTSLGFQQRAYEAVYTKRFTAA
jgi:ribosomal protein S18 acetylase RimI-like enzyme